jgi:hypothetical protein
MTFSFGNLFSYEYIDGDSSVIGGIVEYINVTIKCNINNRITQNMKFNRALLDMEKGIIHFYSEYNGEKSIDYIISSL